MKKLLAVAAMAVLLCLTGMVMSGEAQAQRFRDNWNGTVTDTQTGMLWTKNANPFGRLNWNDAMSRCSSFSISGIGGWRLPSKDELVALYHAIRGGHPFTGVPGDVYWSSTTLAGSTDFARAVYMGNGFVATNSKSYNFRVWPVRAGQ